MKRKCILAGLITLSIAAFAFIGSTVAAGTAYFPTLLISQQGKGAHSTITWYINTTSDGTNGPFSGLDVNTNTIVATCWDAKGTYTVVPYSIVLEQESVYLYFYRKDLPKSAIGCRVDGTLNNGIDTFVASGPGWAWSEIHG